MKNNFRLATSVNGNAALPFVIPRACDFFESSRVFCTRPDVFQFPPKNRHPERSASQIYRITEGFMARSRRTPEMLVGRCSSELSGHKLQGNQKSHKLRPKRSVAEWRDLLFGISWICLMLSGCLLVTTESQMRGSTSNAASWTWKNIDA